MCGIAGIWSPRKPVDDSAGRLSSMLYAMRHRGPDGSGEMHYPGGSTGMVRLALVDLSPRGQQPIWSSDGQVAILFNGEMYNYLDERKRLAENGYAFKTSTDTEVALALYLERGREFPTRMRGMFALAILDFRERGFDAAPSLLLARGPMGIKPLYVARPDGARGPLIFASEIKGLLASGLVPRSFDPTAIEDYLGLGFVLQPRSILRGVKQLDRGTTLWLTPDAKEQSQKFWSLPAATESTDDFETSAQKLRAVLEESVKLHAMADTPVGAFLSGGVDSSGVVAMMARHNSKLRTFTLKLTDGHSDESVAAGEFARSLGCQHEEVEVDGKLVAQHIEKFCEDLDQPSTDGLNTWLISRAAGKSVKGVLSGLGGDEWFAGYPVVRRMAALQHRPWLRALGGVALHAEPLFHNGLVRDRVEKLSARASAATMWLASHQVFHPREMTVLLPGWQQTDPRDRLAAALGGQLHDRSAVDLACQLDVFAYMMCQLLRDSDTTSMASSLELRVPLVDLKVAEFARNCPTSFKLDETQTPPFKRVLVHAMSDLLPKDIATRPKRGFSLPQAQWVAGPLKEVVADTVNPQVFRRRGLFAATPQSLEAFPQTWAMMVFELWCRRVIDPPPPRPGAHAP